MDEQSYNSQQEVNMPTKSSHALTNEQNQFINVRDSEHLQNRNKKTAFTMTDISYSDNNLHLNVFSREYQEFLKYAFFYLHDILFTFFFTFKYFISSCILLKVFGHRETNEN